MENNNTTEEIKCSFCGKSARLVKQMITSPRNKDVYICSNCCQKITSAMAMGLSSKITLESQPTVQPRRTPRQIRAELDKYIIGQDEAKKALSVAIYNHYKRMQDTTGTIKKSNILIAGPSGTGKTLLAKTIAKLLGLPCAITDATTLTASGYAGDDVEMCLQKLMQAAGGDLEKAQRGIVFIDEIDKIACHARSANGVRDIGGEGVQTALLKLVEGTQVAVPLTGNRRTGNNPTVLFDTSQVLFIAGGAFDGMLAQTKAPEIHRPIGFGCSAEPEIKPEPTYETCQEELTTEALIGFGMMREFIGRFPNLVQLNPLNEDDLIRILTEPVDSITKEYQALFKQDGIELEFEEDFLRGIAREALERNVGARGLRSILERTMRELMYELPDMEDLTVCSLTADTLLTGEPELLFSAPFDPETGKRRSGMEDPLTLSA